MAVKRIAGIAFLLVDGRQYPARGDWKVQPNTTSREGIAGQDSVHGFKETPIVPYIEGDVSDFGGISVQALQAAEDVTVTLESANNKVWVLRNGWVAGNIEVETADGKYKVRFEGLDCTELLAA